MRPILRSIATVALLSLAAPFLPAIVSSPPAFSQTVSDRQAEADRLLQQGIRQLGVSQFREAIQSWEQALSIYRAIGDRRGEGNALGNLGIAYAELGQYQRAIDSHQQALVILRVIGDRQGEGAALNNLGSAYANLGQYQQAISFHQQALVIAREIGDRQGEGAALANLGVDYADLGQYQRAIDFYQQVLVIAREIGARRGESITLGNLGLAYRNSGQYQRAINLYEQHLVIARDIGDREGESSSLGNLGLVYADLRQYQRAINFYQQSLSISQAIGDREGEGLTLSNIGRLLALQDQSELAIVFLKQSVNVRESIRGNIRGLDRELQQSYTDTIADDYRHLADLLLQQDRVLEAQRVLDLLKVQELEDYLQDVRGNEQTIDGVVVLQPEAEILERYEALQDGAIELGQELAELRQIPEGDRTATQQQRIARLVELQEDLNEQFNQFAGSPEILALLDQLSPQAVRSTPDLARLDALRENLRSINAVMIYPLVLADRLEIVITTPNSPPLRRTVNVRREDLNRAILQFRQALQDPTRDAKVPAQQLYNWLIAPIEADLDRANVDRAQTQTLLYAPDGQLRYIPLAALYDGQQWLAQRYRVNNITAESLTELTTQPRTQPRILAGAFADVGIEYTVPMGDRSAQFSGLPFAGREVENLSALVTGTTRLIDRAFSLEAIAPRMNEYNIVHFATHAAFVPGAPEASFILFGNGDRPTLRDIGSWTLNDVDLVVLSACETGVGGFGNGEEVLGLGYQFQRRGARAVIASLWQVSDGGTQLLMDAFYLALSNGYSKTEALQRAQQALITGDLTAVGAPRGATVVALSTRTGLPVSVSNNLSHPYYWAPFILIGNGL